MATFVIATKRFLSYRPVASTRERKRLKRVERRLARELRRYF